MTGVTLTQGTREVHWEPDTSLIDTAREIAPIFREHSQEAERERRLSQPVLEALRETGLLRGVTTPRSLGGLETDPVTRALVGEVSLDSAAAWTLENPLDWAFFCCRLPDEGAEEIYSGGADILIAAQFGRPHEGDVDQRRIPHLWSTPFVSNCHDADWIVDGPRGRRRIHGDEPEMRMVYFPSEVRDPRCVGRHGDAGHGQQRHLRDRRYCDAQVQDLSDGAGLRAGITLSRPAVSTPGCGHGGVRHPDADVGGGATSSRRGDRARRNKTPVASSGLLETLGVGPGPAGPSGSDPALRALAAARQPERSVAEMRRQRAPLAWSRGRTSCSGWPTR